MTAVAFDSLPDHPADPLFSFLAERCRDRSDPTVQRYQRVIADLLDFMESVDITPVYGPQVAALLDDRRSIEPHAFLPTLGYAGLVRALPLFLTEPWLPPAGAQRRSHRSLIEHLLVFLRRQGLVDAVALWSDFKAARRAVGTARSRDYGRRAEEPSDSARGKTQVNVELDVPNDILDRLLEGVECGEFESLTEAITGQLRWWSPLEEPSVWRSDGRSNR